MNDHLPAIPTATSSLSDRSGVTDAVRAQILATEHWSLLATRSVTWNEVFSRASMFITALSAGVVALALVAQVTAFGPGFRLFALLVLPVVLLLGVGAILRLGAANTEDFGLVIGMNRLRHGYLELAPELEPYFVTSQYDDQASVLHSYGLGARMSLSRIVAATPLMVGVINVVVAGVFAALVAQTLGASVMTSVLMGVIVAVMAFVGLIVLAVHGIRASRRAYRPLFPR